MIGDHVTIKRGEFREIHDSYVGQKGTVDRVMTEFFIRGILYPEVIFVKLPECVKNDNGEFETIHFLALPDELEQAVTP